MMLRAGHQIGRDQVDRLMRIASIHGVVRGRHTTRTTERDVEGATSFGLGRARWSAPTGPDQLWVTDFTYVWTLAGFCYVAFVTDGYSRRILGWRASTNKTTDLIHAALQQALLVRLRADSAFTAKGLIHHPEAGSQYTSLAFTQSLIEVGIAGSIGTVGDALDSAGGNHDGPAELVVTGGGSSAGFLHAADLGRQGVAVLGRHRTAMLLLPLSAAVVELVGGR